MLEIIFTNIFIPKPSTHSMNDIGLVSCFYIPGVRFEGVYLYGSKCLTNSSCTIRPDCFKPYIPFDISIYTQPPSAMLFKLYRWIISYRIIDIRSLIHSLLGKKLLR